MQKVVGSIGALKSQLMQGERSLLEIRRSEAWKSRSLRYFHTVLSWFLLEGMLKFKIARHLTETIFQAYFQRAQIDENSLWSMKIELKISSS